MKIRLYTDRDNYYLEHTTDCGLAFTRCSRCGLRFQVTTRRIFCLRCHKPGYWYAFKANRDAFFSWRKGPYTTRYGAKMAAETAAKRKAISCN